MNAINISIIAGQLVVGGAEKQLYLWLSHLDRNIFNPVVLTLNPGQNDYWEAPIESLGIPLYRIPHRFSKIDRLINIIQVLGPRKPHLIHGWHLFASSYAGAASKFLGAKSLGSLRSSYQSFRESPQEAFFTCSLLDALLANSQTAARQLSAANMCRKLPIFVVQNAVEDQCFEDQKTREALSRDFGVSYSDTWIGSIGRLYPKKRFDLLLKATKRLLERTGRVQLFLIGDGPERSHLEALAAELGIEKHVTFTGEVPHASAWLGTFDIFCFTSMDEGQPNTVMEAAIAGLPVVSWHLPFMEEIFESRVTALLVEPEDINSLAEGLYELCQSAALRNQLGHTAREHILKNFALDRFVQNMTSVYGKVLGIQGLSQPDLHDIRIP